MGSTSLADVYRWKDDKGQIVFGDTPPKDKKTTVVRIENTKKSGTQFAEPGLIKNIEQEAAQQRQNKPVLVKTVDSYCRRYISDLNKVEIFLEHTNSPRDQQKAHDLRKLIKRECGDNLSTQKFADSYCKRYREDLSKTEIFLEHTNSRRDQNKVIDLRKQIARECE